jgi:hypothetical protein
MKKEGKQKTKTKYFVTIFLNIYFWQSTFLLDSMLACSSFDDKQEEQKQSAQ